MFITNKRGWGLTANKIWSDKDYTIYHDPIYLAVYVDNVLLSGSVRKLEYGDESEYWYFDSLESGKTFDQYEVREVELTNPVTDAQGNITYTDIEPINDGEFTVVVGRAKGATTTENYSYTVTYDTPVNQNQNVRTANVNNIRKGGIEIRLGKWNGTAINRDIAVPLSGGVFTLKLLKKEGDTETVNVDFGKYTSNANGWITTLYDFERGENNIYELAQISSPNGYIALPQPVRFYIKQENQEDKVIMSNREDDGWVNHIEVTGSDQLIAYINTYNKPFELQAVKYNSDTKEKLAGAVFALYRTVTNSSNAYVRDYYPLAGFERLVTDNDGIIPQITSMLDLGRYYLSEIASPEGFLKLSEDIIFVISKSGIQMESQPSGVTLKEDTADDGTIKYTVDIPNSKEITNYDLKLRKTVNGNMGNKAKDFTFTLTVANAEDDDVFEYSKNGVAQTALHSGSTFTMRNGDVVVINLPKNTNITITENNEDYKTQFKFGDANAENTNTKTFQLADNAVLDVINTRNSVLPTGIDLGTVRALFALAVLAVLNIIYVIRKKYVKTR